MVLCIIRQVRKEKNQFLKMYCFPLIEIKSEPTGRLSPIVCPGHSARDRFV